MRLPDHRPKPSRHRSRRQRKKLFIGEFQVMGFSVEMNIDPTLSAEQSDSLFDDFIWTAIEGNGLSCGGGGTKSSWRVFVVPEKRSATEADRAAVQAWLHAQAGIQSSSVSALEDAQYPDDPPTVPTP